MHDEQEALRATSYSNVDPIELEERIGLAARIVLEHVLRVPGIVSPEKKCDIALRAIATLEGSKHEVTWREKYANKPERKSVEAFRAEKKAIADKLIKAAIRRKEIEVAQAELALEAIEQPRDEAPS